MDKLLDDLLTHLWAAWLVFAVVAGLLEVLLPYFTFIFASLGGVVAALVAIRFPFVWQVAAFVVSAAGALVILRPKLLRTSARRHQMISRSEALLGRFGQVTEIVDGVSGRGRVMVEGQDWAARTTSEAVLQVGQKVVIEGHDGIVLLVKES